MIRTPLDTGRLRCPSLPLLETWYIDINKVPEVLAVTLDANDRARHRQIRRDCDRKRYFAGWILARLVLGLWLGQEPAALRFNRTCVHCGDEQHGKPRLSDGVLGPDFSISHAGGLAVVAVSSRTIGVDVEDTTFLQPSLASSLTERERASCPHYADRLQLWTRKEAILKAVGRGLVVHPKRLEVLQSSIAALPEGIDHAGELKLWNLPLPVPYVGSIAIVGNGSPPSVRSGVELVLAAEASLRLRRGSQSGAE